MKGIAGFFGLLLFVAVMFISVPRVSAAIVFPECGWDEITATCECPHADNACADNTCSACLVFKTDPRYRYLWKDIYCRKGSILELAAKYKYTLIIPLLTTIILESIVFAFRGYRKMRELSALAALNIASFFVGIASLRLYSSLYRMSPVKVPNIPFSLYGMDLSRLLSLTIAAAIMVAFEVGVLVRFAGFNDRKKVIVTAVIAHAISLILGLGYLNAVYPHYLQPRLF